MGTVTYSGPRREGKPCVCDLSVSDRAPDDVAMDELQRAILALDDFLTTVALNHLETSLSLTDSSRTSALAAYDLLIGIPELQTYEADQVHARLRRLHASATELGDHRLLGVVEGLTRRD